MEYLDRDVNAFHPEYQYWAQIALEVCRGRLKEPNKVTLKDFLLKFESVTTASSTLEEADKTNEKVDPMKAFFFALTGLSGNPELRKKRDLPKNVQLGPRKPVSSPGPKHRGVQSTVGGVVRKSPTGKRQNGSPGRDA
jgi:hypothetical protein